MAHFSSQVLQGQDFDSAIMASTRGACLNPWLSSSFQKTDHFLGAEKKQTSPKELREQ